MLTSVFHQGRFVALVAVLSTLTAFSQGARAQSIDGAFFAVSELTNGAKGSFVFGSGFGELPKAVALVSGSNVTLAPISACTRKIRTTGFGVTMAVPDPVATSG